MSTLTFPAITIQFEVIGEPETKARARFSNRYGKIHSYTPNATVRAERGVAAEFIKHAGASTPSDSYQFTVDAIFYLGNGQRRDVDNMLKLILDALNKIAWADDNQVVAVHGRKVFDDQTPRTVVTIATVGVMPNRKAVCEHCGNEFPRPPSHAAKKYCDAACRRAGVASKRTRACQSACKDTFWREQRKSAARGTCGDCGGPTTKKSYLLSACGAGDRLVAMLRGEMDEPENKGRAPKTYKAMRSLLDATRVTS